ncbi:hypothetical protein [Paraprevotella xylaniphila]|uniref:hypothetical protein n=1 Tax=Paraprevotella xylaniphila TaxID=454155 RepID=UPI0039F64024
MKQEDIEKAAVDSCVFENSIFNPALTPYYQQGFKDGADWRINSVWHDASERPEKKHANCLVEVKEGDFSFFLVSEFYQSGGFSFMDGICNLVLKRWAYIEDLLPNTEE